MMKKGQIIVEYLMQYGWAILIVMAAIAALIYFGVLSPGEFMPNACMFPTGCVACKDYKVDSSTSEVTIVLENIFDERIDITGFELGEVTCNPYALPVTIDPHTTHTFTLTGCTVSEGKLSSNILVTYQKGSSAISHTIVGQLRVKAD